MTNENVQEKIEKGWILSRMWFEVMAVDKKITKKSLAEHVKKLKAMQDTKIVEEKFESVKSVDNPPKGIEKAFTQIVEEQVLTKNIETLLLLVMMFAPSGVEVIEPKEMKIGIDTLQTIMNSVADMMHRFAASGVGGIVISGAKA